MHFISTTILLSAIALQVYSRSTAGQRKNVVTVYSEMSISRYANPANLRLILYDIPDAGDVTHWCFSGRNKQRNPNCPIVDIIVYLQRGSIPTAQYLGSKTFPDNVTVHSGSLLNITFKSGSSACKEIMHPVSGTWFAAAYINGTEQNKAVTKNCSAVAGSVATRFCAVFNLSAIDCSYTMQANVTTAVSLSVIDIGVGLPTVVKLLPGLTRFRYPIYGNVRNYNISANCSFSSFINQTDSTCPIVVTARAGGLPLDQHTDQQVSLNCSVAEYCTLNFTSPAVEQFHYMNVFNIHNNSDIYVQFLIQSSGCQPVEKCHPNDTECDPSSGSTTVSISTVTDSWFNGNDSTTTLHTTESPHLMTPAYANGDVSSYLQSIPNDVSLLQASSNDTANWASLLYGLSTPVPLNYTTVAVENFTDMVSLKPSSPARSSGCNDNIAGLTREDDAVVAFDSSWSATYLFDNTAVYVARFDIDQFKDTGGSLSFTAKMYQKESMTNSIRFCLQPAAIPTSHSYKMVCGSDAVSSVLSNRGLSSFRTNLVYPVPGPWFLGFQATCSNSTNYGIQKCGPLALALDLQINACVNSGCSNSGQCRSATKGIYSYTFCYCIAGYRGFTCEDDSEAPTHTMQIVYTSLLTLSNLGFIPAIAVACYRRYFVEAVVYLANMFFSLFYHWCDMSTWSTYVVCIAPYNSLQFCDFMCSVLSFWTTLLAVAKLKYDKLRFVLLIFGVFALMLPVHINHTGLVTNIVPLAVGVAIVIASWIPICIRTKKFYPPLRRWACLLPGIAIAGVGLCLFAFAETDTNYPYTHSAWHLCMSLSIVFFLPTSKSGMKDGSSSDTSSFELDEQSRPPLISCRAIPDDSGPNNDGDDAVATNKAYVDVGAGCHGDDDGIVATCEGDVANDDRARLYLARSTDPNYDVLAYCGLADESLAELNGAHAADGRLACNVNGFLSSNELLNLDSDGYISRNVSSLALLPNNNEKDAS